MEEWTSFDFLLEEPEEEVNDVGGTVTWEEPERRGWARMHQQLLETNLSYFASELLSGPAEAPYLGRFLVSEHHEEWGEIVSSGDRLCVLAPRDHGKTWYFDFAYPIWQAWRTPNKTGFIFSATKEQASRILEDIKSEIETNPHLQHLLPTGKKKKWASNEIRLGNGHKIYARGFGTRVRGAHPYWIVADDVLNDETAWSELTRQKQVDYFYNAVTPMCTPGGQIIVVGCVTLDTWVPTELGMRRIGDLCPGELKPQTAYDFDLGVHGRNGIKRTSKFWVNGECPTKRVTLERGYRVEGSHRHPLLVMGHDGLAEFKRSDEIEVGDYVAVQSGAEAWGAPVDLRPFKALPRSHGWSRNGLELPDTLTPDLGYLLGLWTAEGSYEGTGRVAVSNTEESIRAWLESAPFGMQFRANTTEGSEQTLRCSSKTFLELIEWLGGRLGKAPEKIIPRAIFEGTRETAKAFLQGYFDGDGNADVKNQQVSAASTSEELARGVQQLLLNFGIVSSLSSRPTQASERVPNPQHDLWVVRSCGQDARRYLEEVGFRLSRKQAAQADMRPSSRTRTIPHQGALMARMRKEKPDRRRGRTMGVTAVKPPEFSISQIAKNPSAGVGQLSSVLDWFDAAGAEGPATEAFRANIEESRRGRVWLPVESVEDSTAFTVDFVVPDGHSFVSNGIVSHNTPFHTLDLYGDLSKNSEYQFHRFQAVDPKTNKALWPERYSSERLASRRREVGEIRFTREYLCEPVSDDMSLFPSWLFTGDPVEQPQVKLGMAKEFWDELGVEIFMAVDFAISSSVKADYTVIWLMGVDARGNRWIVDMIRERGLSYEAQKSLIIKYGRRYDPGLIFLESNQMQRIWGDQLIQETDLPIKKFITTGQEKHSLEKGLPSLRVLLENKKFRIPMGDRRSAEMMDVWKDEMRSFTFQNGKLQSIGAHDDTVMACIAPGALITTIRGKKPIEEIAVGDTVLTHRGRWRKVTATMVNPYEGEAYKVRGAGGAEFTITPEHPIWTTSPKRDTVANNQRLLPDADAWGFRETKDVRAGDYGFCPAPEWAGAKTGVAVDGLAVRFSKVQKVQYKGPVHNFTVEEDESYVVEDLAVHNCWICDQAIRLGYFDFAFDGESADADGKQVNLDELLKRQFDEGDANKASEFDEDVTKILGKEKELSQHVRDDLQPAPVTIGHSDDEEGEGDPDDVFSGLPLGARGKAWSL